MAPADGPGAGGLSARPAAGRIAVGQRGPAVQIASPPPSLTAPGRWARCRPQALTGAVVLRPRDNAALKRFIAAVSDPARGFGQYSGREVRRPVRTHCGHDHGGSLSAQPTNPRERGLERRALVALLRCRRSGGSAFHTRLSATGWLADPGPSHHLGGLGTGEDRGLGDRGPRARTTWSASTRLTPTPASSQGRPPRARSAPFPHPAGSPRSPEPGRRRSPTKG